MISQEFKLIFITLIFLCINYRFNTGISSIGLYDLFYYHANVIFYMGIYKNYNYICFLWEIEMNKKILSLSLIMIVSITACNSNSNNVDKSLRSIIDSRQLTGDVMQGRDIPSIDSPKAQLGMRLFFSKSLGGDRDSSCVTCHHPTLCGGDNLSLSVGVAAEDPNLLGVGRLHDSNAPNFDGSPPVPRNAPTTFNIAGWDEVLFHDGRVESLGKTPQAIGGDGLGIRTPDSIFGISDPNSGMNLVVAQARFPVTSPEEMKAFNHNDKDNQGIREYLSSRIGGYGLGTGELTNTDYWLTQFQTAFDMPTGTPEELIVELNIASLLAAYESSQAFTNTPWKAYVDGDSSALSDSAKEGALLFFNNKEEGGADCGSCHSGDLFSDEKFHNTAMPQIGHGKGDGNDGSADFGRFRETGEETDKFAFRTPTLLNVEVTGPWSHAGAYGSLEAVIKHHLKPSTAVIEYDFTQLVQTGIANLDKMQSNTQAAVDKLEADRLSGLNVIQDITLSDEQVIHIKDFLIALTDPCVKDRACIAKWIPDSAEDPNGDQLDATDVNAVPL